MVTNSNTGVTEYASVVVARSLSDATLGFLEHCRVAKGLAPNTLRAYASDLAHARRVLGGETVVTAIGRDAVREYVRRLLDDERPKETTAKRRIATLKVLFRWLEREEVVPISVFHRLDLSIRLPKHDGGVFEFGSHRAETPGAGARLLLRVPRAFQALDAGVGLPDFETS